jgi:hypothetical protein
MKKNNTKKTKKKLKVKKRNQVHLMFLFQIILKKSSCYKNQKNRQKS